ncbi:MAG: sensor histidine kinase [Actinobacteria bacterium]|nr:sensor histidine kinase [Actinomycetota bacterium]MBU1942806.1 sensor histidine kinase [Actinomycetota bacterium]MBU2686128.1 sensor histidine kinase [Actinomycetota bacterium]
MSEQTKFAPAERLDEQAILEENEMVASAAYVREMINAMPLVVGVLNRYRQFVYFNRSLLELLEIEGAREVLGMRPGEAVGCIHADEESGGCGTSESCRYCGAVCTVLESARTNSTVSGECRIATRQAAGGALDLSVSACPFEVGGRSFTLLAMNDISAQKRRRNLERIFFHDITNTAVVLNNVITLLGTCRDEAEMAEELANMQRVSGSLIEDIRAQKDLADAESGDLKVNPESIDSVALLVEAAELVSRHRVARDRLVVVEDGAEDFTFTGDRRLVRRILVNMLKNAVEAADEGDTVTAGAAVGPDTVRLHVSGPGFMPREVQLQVFNRSFSTRGEDRGLGTYSMKLLAERYLGGSVSFTTSQEEGTTFTLELPVEQ